MHFLDEAGALAQILHAELAALFVEEVELVRLADLPFSREIGVATGSVLEFDPDAIARRHRQQAAAIRAHVASTARTLELAWSFDITSGSLLEAALEFLADPDLLMLEPAPSAVQHALGRTMMRPARPGARPGAVIITDVAVLYDASPAADRALEMGLRLAGGRPDGVTLVVDGDADVQSVRQSAADLMGVPALSSPVVTIADLGPGCCPRALVVPLARFAAEPSALRALRASAHCPLVLVP